MWRPCLTRDVSLKQFILPRLSVAGIVVCVMSASCWRDKDCLYGLNGPVEARILSLTSMSSTQTAAAAGTTGDSLSRQLQEWTQSSFTDLYNHDRDPQTQALFTPDAQITVNGDKLSLDKFDEHIKELRGAATRVDILWGDVLAIPEDESVRSRLSPIIAATLTRVWNSTPYYSKDLTPSLAL